MVAHRSPPKIIPNIALDEQTYERLKCCGLEEDTFPQIINKLIDVAIGKRDRRSVIGHKNWIENQYNSKYMKAIID